MTCAKWLSIVGGVLLLLGLVTALVAWRYESRLMGQAGRGVAVLAPDIGSPDWKEKERLRRIADCWFWVGVAATACGVILQTLGAVLPLK